MQNRDINRKIGSGNIWKGGRVLAIEKISTS